MTSRIELDLSLLFSAARRMEAPAVVVSLGRRLPPLRVPDELGKELVEGVSVDVGEIDVTPGGLLSYQGFQVVLYIPDQGQEIDKVLRDGAEGKRVHVAFCKTLEWMKAGGRYQRYVARNGFEPSFRVSGWRKRGIRRRMEVIENVEAQLQVCRNCLDELNYLGFRFCGGSTKREIVREFSLEAFFDRYHSHFDFLPNDHDVKYRANVYPDGWDKISRQVRKRFEWICDECGVRLADVPQLLHVHHRDGNKGNNRESNLVALCADCHAKQPFHGHMFVAYSDRLRLQELRRAQRVYPRLQGESDAAWRETMRCVDPALLDVVDVVRRSAGPPPESGLPIQQDGEEVARADLAWPRERVAMFIRKPRDATVERLREAGWKTSTPWELLRR